MTNEYGSPLTGTEMKLLRAAGLSLNEPEVFYPPVADWVPCGGKKTIYPDESYRLPADHPAYTMLKKGWLDIPNVRLWFGGDKAPEDWGGGDVLLQNGEVLGAREIGFWWHDDMGENIIAYIAKVEASYPADGGLKDRVRDPSECQSAFQTITENVTIAKMTEAEAKALWMFSGGTKWTFIDRLRQLGLIKPEPTLEERFWQGKERNSLSQDEAVKALVREAVKFGQENPE